MIGSVPFVAARAEDASQALAESLLDQLDATRLGDVLQWLRGRYPLVKLLYLVGPLTGLDPLVSVLAGEDLRQLEGPPSLAFEARAR